MGGKWFFAGFLIVIFAFIFGLFALPPISFLLLIGILLVLGFIPMGPIAALVGVILSAVASGILWGLGGAALVGGIALSYWGATLRGPEELAWLYAPRITHSLLFKMLTGPFSILLVLIGIVVLVRGCF